MKSIQLLGMKHTGKSTLGRLLAQKTSRTFYDLDTLLEQEHDPGRPLTSREIYKSLGKEAFQRYEAQAAQKAKSLLDSGTGVLAWGGGTITNPQAVEILGSVGYKVFLDENCEVIYQRIMKGGLPAFLSADHPWEDFQRLYQERTEKMRAVCDLIIDLRGCEVDAALEKVIKLTRGV